MWHFGIIIKEGPVKKHHLVLFLSRSFFEIFATFDTKFNAINTYTLYISIHFTNEVLTNTTSLFAGMWPMSKEAEKSGFLLLLPKRSTPSHVRTMRQNQMHAQDRRLRGSSCWGVHHWTGHGGKCNHLKHVVYSIVFHRSSGMNIKNLLYF